MPKVWVPKEPLVVTAKICGAVPLCPLQAIEPSPQPVLSMAMALEDNVKTVARAEAR